MSEGRSLRRKFAMRLLGHAAGVLPVDCSDWGQAMRNELACIENDSAALRWAIGCLLACYRRNIEGRTMKAVSVRRIALSVEMLFCFVPVTGGLFLATLFAGYLPQTTPSTSALLLTTSLVGPLGLIFAFRSIVMERRHVSTRIGIVLLALAVWTAFGNSFFVLTVADPVSDVRAIAVMALLPVAGIAHLLCMSLGQRNCQ